MKHLDIGTELLSKGKKKPTSSATTTSTSLPFLSSIFHLFFAHQTKSRPSSSLTHSSLGPKYYDAAAKCFIRVLKIYHDPMQLLMIIESTVPPAVFSLIMDLMAKDVGMAGAGNGASVVQKQPTVEEIE